MPPKREHRTPPTRALTRTETRAITTRPTNAITCAARPRRVAPRASRYGPRSWSAAMWSAVSPLRSNARVRAKSPRPKSARTTSASPCNLRRHPSAGRGKVARCRPPPDLWIVGGMSCDNVTPGGYECGDTGRSNAAMRLATSGIAARLARGPPRRCVAEAARHSRRLPAGNRPDGRRPCATGSLSLSRGPEARRGARCDGPWPRCAQPLLRPQVLQHAFPSHGVGMHEDRPFDRSVSPSTTTSARH